jgi:urease accessory protein UreH
MRLERTIYGNGRPGLVDKLNEHTSDFHAFESKWDARQEDKKIYDDRQSRRVNTMLVAAGVIIALGSAIISLLLYEHESSRAQLKLPSISSSAIVGGN